MSDKEQRDLAEKIRQENLQQEKAALEALKKQENTDQEEEGIKVEYLFVSTGRRCKTMFSMGLSITASLQATDEKQIGHSLCERSRCSSLY